MDADKPKTVTVESIEWHTHDGKTYPVGATYEAPADLVDSLVVQGKAKPVEKAKPAAAKKPSRPVTPMSTKDIKTAPHTARKK